jgi:acid phosphatase family membrane protein YuiD
LKATGPKTKAGKQAVALNALKHGMCSQSFQAEVQRLRELIDELDGE